MRARADRCEYEGRSVPRLRRRRAALAGDEPVSYKLEVRSYKLQVTSCKLQVTSYKLQVTSYKLQVASCKLQVTRYKLQVTSYKLQATSYKLQVTSYKLQVAGSRREAVPVLRGGLVDQGGPRGRLVHDRGQQARELSHG